MKMKLFVKTQGRILGPIDAENILALVAKRRIAADATISEDKRYWIPIAELPALFQAAQAEAAARAQAEAAVRAQAEAAARAQAEAARLEAERQRQAASYAAQQNAYNQGMPYGGQQGFNQAGGYGASQTGYPANNTFRMTPAQTRRSSGVGKMIAVGAGVVCLVLVVVGLLVADNINKKKTHEACKNNLTLLILLEKQNFNAEYVPRVHKKAKETDLGRLRVSKVSFRCVYETVPGMEGKRIDSLSKDDPIIRCKYHKDNCITASGYLVSLLLKEASENDN